MNTHTEITVGQSVKIGSGRATWQVESITAGMATVTRDPEQWERARKVVAVSRLIAA